MRTRAGSRQGDGRAGAADARARLHAARAGGRCASCSRAATACSRSTTAASARARSRPGPYTVEELAGDAAQVLDEAGVERAHVVGASLGGFARRRSRPTGRSGSTGSCSPARRPAAPGAYPLPEGTLRLMAEAPSLAPDVALRRFVENAVAPGSPPALVDEIYAYRQAHPPDPAGWAAQAARRRGVGRRRPARADHGADARRRRHRRRGRRPAQLAAARRARSPARALELIEGAGHLLFWERSEEFAGLWSKGSSDDRRSPSTGCCATAPARRRDRVAIEAAGRDVDVRRARRRSDELAASLEPGSRVSTLTGNTRRARRRLLRLREGGRDPAPDLVAARARRGRLPARRRRAGACSSSRTSTRALAEAALALAARRARRSSRPAARRPRARARARRPAAARSTRRGTTGKPKGALLTHANCFWTNLSFDLATGARPARRRAAGAAAVPLRRLERAAAARVVEGRAGRARARLRRRRARSS